MADDQHFFALEWTLQSKTSNQSIWVSSAGYVHEQSGAVTWGVWGQQVRNHASSIDEAKEKVELDGGGTLRLLEEAITGEWGPCIKCGEHRLGTPQGGGEVLCLHCQNRYKRELRLR